MLESPRWAELWRSVVAVKCSESKALLQELRSLSMHAAFGMIDNDEVGPTTIAMVAHRFASTFDDASLAVLLRMDQKDTALLLWKHRLACLMLVEYLSETYGPKMESPFYPVLIRDSIALLQAVEKEKDGQNADSRFAYACLLDFVESLFPNMLGLAKFRTIEKEMRTNTLDQAEIDILTAAADRWTSAYHDDQYLEPLLRPEATDMDEGLIKMLQDARPVSPDTLCKPLASLDVPLARPFPLPLLPILAFDSCDNVALTPAEDQAVAEYLQGELIWLTPTNLRLMLLPDDEEDDLEATERYREVLDLLTSQAFQKPLAPNSQRMVMQMLSEKDDDDNNIAHRLVHESNLSPQNLPRLVEHNPLVAHECLLRILSTTTSENEKNEYMSSLIGMDMSLHTMEVVNRLATHQLLSGEPLLHPEYIQLFISSCIANCENLVDRHAQNRLVRLVCVFVQSLLRHKIVSVDDIYFEVQAFCVEFSRIREAAALFKSLKDNIN